MAVTVYRSTDASAPVLSGTVDSLALLLRAVLVDGYGAKAAAGWTESFDGVNKKSFKQGGGNLFHLRVDDSGPGLGGAREARVRGFETMSDVDTGTGSFPTTAQATDGLFIRKSATADATARPWKVIADNRTLMLFTLTGDAANVHSGFYFGDFFSLLAGDGFRTAIVGRVAENSAAMTTAAERFVRFVATHNSTVMFVALADHFYARGYTGTGGSVNLSKYGDPAFFVGSDSGFYIGSLAYPNPTDGGLYISRFKLHDPTTAPVNHLRGSLRGVWAVAHAISNFVDGDTFTGTGALAGRTFEVVKEVGGGALVAIETSNTWDTSA